MKFIKRNKILTVHNDIAVTVGYQRVFMASELAHLPGQFEDPLSALLFPGGGGGRLEAGGSHHMQKGACAVTQHP